MATSRVTVKTTCTQEPNIGNRTWFYEVHVDGEFHSMSTDVLEASEIKQKLIKELEENKS